MPGDRRSRAGRAAALVAAVAAVLLSLPGTAWADDSLISADPASGAALGTAPRAVTLRFSADVSGGDSHVAVSAGGDGDVTADEVSQPTPTELRVPIEVSVPGDLTVAYHVIFLDGGSATGVYRFSVGTGAAPAPLSGSARQAATAAVANHVHQVDGASAVLLVVDGAVLVVVLFLLWARPRDRRRNGAGAWRYRED